MIVQGIQTIIAKKPYIFVIFQRGGGPYPLSPFSGSAHDHAGVCSLNYGSVTASIQCLEEDAIFKDVVRTWLSQAVVRTNISYWRIS